MPSTSMADSKNQRSWLVLAIFLVLVIGVGGLIGSQSAPGGWYQNLQKPPFNPPNWIFAPVWLILYVMIAIAGWRIWSIDKNGTAMQLWGAQMLLNWAWTPVWFIANLIWPALAIIVALLAVIIAFIITTRRQDPVSAWLFLPYAAWVAFATLLNASIAILN